MYHIWKRFEMPKVSSEDRRSGWRNLIDFGKTREGERSIPEQCQGPYLYLLCRSASLFPSITHSPSNTTSYNMIIIHSRPLLRTLARNSTQASLLAITRRTLTTTSNLNLHATLDPHAAPLVGADGKVLVGSKRSFQPHPTGKLLFLERRGAVSEKGSPWKACTTEISISVVYFLSTGHTFFTLWNRLLTTFWSITDAIPRPLPPAPTAKLSDLSEPHNDWVLFHPVYSAEEVNCVKVVRQTRVTTTDKVASALVKFARWGFDFVTRYKHSSPEAALEALRKAGKAELSLTELREQGYIMTEAQWMARILFLESIAGVPGFVAAMLRHLTSLRLMKRDGGWIASLLQEAENERMHLMTFLKIKQPSPFFRAIVIVTQGWANFLLPTLRFSLNDSNTFCFLSQCLL